MQQYARRKASRSGTAAVEFAVCFAFVMLPFLAGLWEIGRIVEIQQVAYNAAREGARSASTAAEYLDPGPGGINTNNPRTPNVANDVLVYLQSAEPNAFGQNAVTWSKAATLPPNAVVGYTCTDSVTKKVLFTISYGVLTSVDTAITDPINAKKLDNFQIGIQIPYASVAISPLAEFFSGGTIYSYVNWACMADAPFSVPNILPAQ